MIHRTLLLLPVESTAGSVNPARLLLRSGGQTRPFLPHSREVWQRLTRRLSGGPALPIILARAGSPPRPARARSRNRS
jgi:hypothetical protein